MATMDEEEMKRMAAMAAQMQGPGSMPAAAAAAGTTAAGSTAAGAGSMPSPEMAAQALGSMSPEQLSAMAQAAGGAMHMPLPPCANRSPRLSPMPARMTCALV